MLDGEGREPSVGDPGPVVPVSMHNRVNIDQCRSPGRTISQCGWLSRLWQ
jgi:hypothetical protein